MNFNEALKATKKMAREFATELDTAGLPRTTLFDRTHPLTAAYNARVDACLAAGGWDRSSFIAAERAKN